MESLKDLLRPPFANYDVVVYFGGGLFFIPFINRYLIQPSAMHWPDFRIEIGSKIANELVSGLSLLFSIYILGHILAYLSSQLIEKLTDRILGKISTAIIISAWASNRRRNEHVRALIWDRVKSIKADRALFSTTVRLLFHLPVFPLYLFVFTVGIFGYYNTRVPQSVITAMRAKLNAIGIPDLRVGIRTKWFKPVEYFVMNRNSSATSRMYNYLVIGGLFRTLCFIFLSVLWVQIYFQIHFWLDAEWFLDPLMKNRLTHPALFEYMIVTFVYMFCLFSYLKFQRRYAEEAIFAFVFGSDGTSALTAHPDEE